jgi:hypothetical protein
LAGVEQCQHFCFDLAIGTILGKPEICVVLWCLYVFGFRLVCVVASMLESGSCMLLRMRF